MRTFEGRVAKRLATLVANWSYALTPLLLAVLARVDGRGSW